MHQATQSCPKHPVQDRGEKKDRGGDGDPCCDRATGCGALTTAYTIKVGVGRRANLASGPRVTRRAVRLRLITAHACAQIRVGTAIGARGLNGRVPCANSAARARLACRSRCCPEAPAIAAGSTDVTSDGARLAARV
eukprot:7383548-Prymnesium_polylepis.2